MVNLSADSHASKYRPLDSERTNDHANATPLLQFPIATVTILRRILNERDFNALLQISRYSLSSH